MKRIVTAVLSILLLLGMAGCSAGDVPEGPTELWVVTEETTGDGMNYIASVLAERFAQENPGCSIRLDILPTDATEREAYLTSLRVKIAAGDGPDLYLLPSSAVFFTDRPTKYTPYRLESLFPDVNLAMMNRKFADLSKYYAADEALGKDGLLDIVMDAGIWDNKQFVLPLRFDMGAYCIVPELLEQTGIAMDCFLQNADVCQETVLNSDNELLIAGLYAFRPQFVFSHSVDYKTGKINTQKDDLLRFTDLNQKISNRVVNSGLFIGRYLFSRTSFNPDLELVPMNAQSLSCILDASAIAYAHETDITFLPIHDMDGSVNAHVTYYGAVDAACTQPELAYRYLRMFLSEEVQWEALRREPVRTQYPALLESSLPVRTAGCLTPIWERYQQQGDKLYHSMEPDETSLEKITAQIDSVDFETDALLKLDYVCTSKTPEQDVDAWLEELDYSLMEG